MDIVLILAALLPALVLCIYVFNKDRAEKEPLSLLLKLLVLGVISCFPIVAVSSPLCDIISIKYYADSGSGFYVYQFMENFVGVALVEELGKLIFLILGSAKSKYFNSLFDGVIYAVFVSLGFAAFENILYVSDGGLSVALLRAVSAVPGHMFFGVLMGYHYSMWHISRKAKKIEKQLRKEGLLPKGRSISTIGNLFKSLIIPVLAHGAYDFCCSIGSVLFTLIFIAFVIFLYRHCFKKIKTLSQQDGDTHDYALLMLVEKYPEDKSVILQQYF